VQEAEEAQGGGEQGTGGDEVRSRAGLMQMLSIAPLYTSVAAERGWR
jgi:hypothetical protein